MNKFPYEIKIFFLLIVLISLIKSQPNITEINLSQVVKGSMLLDDSYLYYSIKMPSNIKDYENMLVIKISDGNSQNLKEEQDLFSDPDFHVSTNDKYPSMKSHEWFCEKYGSDILSISSNFVAADTIFYIGVYCQFKCRYEFTVYLSKEVEIEPSKFYKLELKKNTSSNYYINIPDKDYEELDIVAKSKNLKEFKIYVNQESPSSQNTYEVIPSWNGGYMIPIEKKSKAYCKDCEIHILLQSGNENDVQIVLGSYFLDKEVTLQKVFPFYDSLKRQGRRCYKFPIDSRDRLINKNMAIQVTVFSGFVSLYVGGWNNITETNPTRLGNKPYYYNINNEKVIFLNKSDFDIFDSNYKEIDKSKTNYLNFCIFANHKSSFLISTYFISDAPIFQKYNYLVSGVEVSGFLENNNVTSYTLLEYSKDGNITINLEEIEGNMTLYAYFCYLEERCFFTNEFLSNSLSTNKIIDSVKSFKKQEIEILYGENICQKKNNEANSKIECSTLAVVKCLSEFCSYKIKLTTLDSSFLMSPKKIYYGIIPKGISDNYKIIVDDPSVTSIVAVLNTISGDAELVAYYQNPQGNTRLIGYSLNNDYMPDVIRIVPKNINQENLIGTYQIKVTTNSFSSYNLYYYTTMKQDFTKPKLSDVTLDLSEGKIIMDYFPNNIAYKIYSYTPPVNKNDKAKDIRIVLTRLAVSLDFKVYLDFSKFKYYPQTNKDHPQNFEGYLWSSDNNGELTISSKDKDYSFIGPYFIVVTKPSAPNPNMNLDSKAVAEFYLGATRINQPFYLKSGLEHSSTLNDNYSKQIYLFSHTESDKPFELTVNLFYGAVDVFVDTHKFSEEDINASPTPKVAFYDFKVKDYKKITITTNYLSTHCRNFKDFRCDIYIYIRKSYMKMDSSYVVIGKSDALQGEKLNPGIVRKERLWRGEHRHFILEEIQKRKGSIISVTYYNGAGNIYVRIPDKYETTDKLIYPTRTNFQFKGEEDFYGQSVKIPSFYFDRINSTNPKIQILITIYATEVNKDNADSEQVEFVISYSGEPKRINQNVPYYNYIQFGETQYFLFYFDHTVNSIYISLSNMDGDADLFLTYGNDNYPTPGNSTWSSQGSNHEFLSILKTDSFFKENNKESLEGYYTLLIYGFANSTYTLFVTGQDKIIMPLIENTPLTCRCKNKNDQCFYSYNDLYSYNYDGEGGQADIKSLFTARYLYGAGVMYAKLYTDKDLFDKEKKPLEDFPNENSYDFSSLNNQYRNILDVTINQNSQFYTQDILLLLTLKCLEPSIVDVSMAPINTFTEDFLDLNRENTFYLRKSNNPSLFTFYNVHRKDIIYEITPFKGKGNFLIYANITIDNTTGKNEYIKISEMQIGSNIHYYSSIDSTYFGTIANNKTLHKQNIYFQVTPKQDFAFFIKLIYSKKWTRIELSKSKEYYINDNLMFGFFDVLNEYSNIEISILLNNHFRRKAYCYLTINTIDKSNIKLPSLSNPDADDEYVYNYTIPSKVHYDYKGESDPLLGSILLRLTNLPKISNSRNIIRVLFTIKILNERRHEDLNNEYDETPQLHRHSKVSILVTPGVDKTKNIDVLPYKFYFSNVSNIDKNEIESKIYTLEKINPSDNVFIIQLSSCVGSYTFNIYDNILYYYNNSESNVKYNDKKTNGVHMITILNAELNRYYLVIKPKVIDHSACKILPELCKQDKGSSYLMYYYSTSKFMPKLIKPYLSYEPYGRGGIKIHTPYYHYQNIENERVPESDIKFSVIISENEDDYDKMGSVCYLSRTMMNSTSTQYYSNIKYKDGAIIIKGLKTKQQYYINLLAENIYTNELTTFTPIAVVSGGYINYPTWLLILFVVILLVALIAIGYFYRRYKITKKVLSYEVNDIRNMGALPKSDRELSTIIKETGALKFQGLASNTENI